MRFGLYGNGGKKLGTVNASLKTRISVPVVVASRAVAHKQMISAKDVAMKLAPYRLGQRAYAELKQVIGKRARTVLTAGKPVNVGSVEEPPLVLRGQDVMVTARIGRMVISHRGKAMGRGAAGDIVTIKNLETGGVYSARVLRDGKLELVAAP